MAVTTISQRAEQEFYDELDDILKKQSADWQAMDADQKVLTVPADDFAYYVKIRQQSIDQSGSSPLEEDADGLPIVFYRDIRLKPTDG
ncbi:hypothetical protein GCM10027341_47870 [Spirosoma knui]